MASKRSTGKRGNGEGSITLRADGRWEARITLEGGRRKSYYAQTRQEAARRLAAGLRDHDRGLPIVAEQQTVRHYLTDWLETIKPTLKPRTWRRYEEALRLRVIPRLGDTRLSKVTAQQVQALYAAALSDGSAPATVAHVHAVFHRALEAAERLGLVARNVTELVTPPRPAHREIHALSAEQARVLLAAAHGARLEALYVLALAIGARLGELLALTWEDVDLDAGHLQVRHTLYHGKGGAWALTAPKTSKSRRKIDLPAGAVEALRAHRARQIEERLALGPAWSDHGFLFCRPDGEPLRGTHVLERDFLPLLHKAGLPRCRFHDLRHTAATLALLQGMPTKMVSEMLGHSSTAITSDVYSHVTPTMQKALAAAMQAILWG